MLNGDTTSCTLNLDCLTKHPFVQQPSEATASVRDRDVGTTRRSLRACSWRGFCYLMSSSSLISYSSGQPVFSTPTALCTHQRPKATGWSSFGLELLKLSHGWQFLFISWLARVFVATLTSIGYNGSTEREVGIVCIPLRGLKWFMRNKESSKITVANLCVLKISDWLDNN